MERSNLTCRATKQVATNRWAKSLALPHRKPCYAAVGDLYPSSLNDRSAVSFSVAPSVTGATHITAPGGRKRRVPGSSSNSTTLNIGASYVLPSGWTIDGQLAAGLTPDAPNFVFSMRGSKSF